MSNRKDITTAKHEPRAKDDPPERSSSKNTTVGVKNIDGGRNGFEDNSRHSRARRQKDVRRVPAPDSANAHNHTDFGISRNPSLADNNMHLRPSNAYSLSRQEMSAFLLSPNQSGPWQQI